MALRVQTQISGDVFVLRCDGRIVFGDEGAVLRERVGKMLSGSPKIVVNLSGVHYLDSGELGILVGLSVSAKNRGGELKLVSPSKRERKVRHAGCFSHRYGCRRMRRSWAQSPRIRKSA